MHFLTFFPILEQRMCLGTFYRLRWSLATSSVYAAVRILPEAFCIIGNAISYYTKKRSIALAMDLKSLFWRRHVGIEPTRDALNAPH